MSEQKGIKKQPKLKGLLLQKELSRTVVRKGLEELEGLPEEEMAEVKRLLARLDARR